jgi:hypothetical protein
MPTQSRIPSSAAAIGIVLIALGAVVVMLLAGGPDRWAAAAGLLVGVPVLIAMGGAVDEARRTRPRISPPASATPSEDGRPPRNALVRTSFALAAVRTPARPGLAAARRPTAG